MLLAINQRTFFLRITTPQHKDDTVAIAIQYIDHFVSKNFPALTLVRTGIAMYGLTPAPSLGTTRGLGLEPAMTLRAALAGVKEVEAGTSVSYGSTWTTTVPTRLGLVPLGYADGVPRTSGGRVEVTIDGRRFPAVG